MALLTAEDLEGLPKIDQILTSKEYTDNASKLTKALEQSDLCWAKIKHSYDVADADALVDPTANVIIKEILIYYTGYKMALSRVGLNFRDQLDGNTIDIWKDTSEEWKGEYEELLNTLREEDIWEDKTDEDIESNSGRIVQLNYA